MSDPKCDGVREDLAPLVDGDGECAKTHADHLADCDGCRDARHQAREVVKMVGDAGADFREPAGAEARLLAALDARAKKPEAEAKKAEPAPEAKKAEPGPAPEVKKAEPAPEAKKAEPAPEAKKAEARPEKVEAEARMLERSTPPRVARRRPTGRFVMAAAAVFAAVFGASILYLGDADEGPPPVRKVEKVGGEAGKVARILRAGSSAGGLEIKGAGAAAEGATLAAGATLRTDELTRARLALSDGSSLVLDHSTEVVVVGPRQVRLVSGQVFADVAHLEGGANAVYELPQGKVEVLGTAFALTAASDQAAVRVTRGVVRLESAQGYVQVFAGQEGLLPAAGAPSVAAAGGLADAVSWSELDDGTAADDAPVPGLGRLRAKKPGERQEQERSLALARHKVTVRISGPVARTEIEEVFRNDSGDTLEGIYTLPLAADARIERLALEVDGKMMEGAFVESARATKIWRGVIQNATPKENRPVQEIIWVPGPWRDPALLEWKRGGQVELRIFPIPARGERRVVVAYTQTLAPRGEGRRYVYPLAHSSTGVSPVQRFEVDARVAGADPARKVAALGYPVTAAPDGDATRLSFTRDGFLPAGDLIIDYALPDAKAALRTYAYAPETKTVPPPTPAAKPAGSKAPPEDAAVIAARQAVAADARAYAAFALRPSLPPWTAQRARDFVFVVDTSQSMVGERQTRAVRLVASLVELLDRRDRFSVLACDVTCRAMSGPQPASARAAADAAAWLAAIAPAGATDLGAALAFAATTAGRPADREVRVVYIGDGVASVGHRRPAALAYEAGRLTSQSGARFSAVGIGADADSRALAAVARAGGGHYVPFVPGERVARTALSVLETTYGVALESPTVTLPLGVEAIAPAALPTIRAGEEVLVVGRFQGEIKGELVLRGTVAGQAFEQKFPIALAARAEAGNAFAARLWADATIQDLESSGRAEDGARVIALSQRYGVLSRSTSLLVLESDAMFTAFGVERHETVAGWTGEEETDATVADATSGTGVGMGPGGGGKRGVLDDAEEASDADDKSAEPRAKSPARVAPPPPAATGTTASEARLDPVLPPRDNSRGYYARREWVQVGAVLSDTRVRSGEDQAVSRAEAALAASPDSRDRHRDLVRALSRQGDLVRARAAAEAWLARDRLDVEALTYLSDAIGRAGDRDGALRYLSGVVDLAADDPAPHRRLAAAYDRAGLAERACAHRVALADVLPADAAAAGAALRCERAIGRADAASRMLAALDPKLVVAAEKVAAAPATVSDVRGAIVLDATWTGSSDVELSMITPQGTRLSWMGGRTTVVADSAGDLGRERLGLSSATSGSYVIEVTRSRLGDTVPVSGRIRVRVLGQDQTLPFNLNGERAVVGRVDIRREERLVEINVAPLTPAEIRSAMERVRPGVEACARTHGVADVRARVTVSGGRITSVSILGSTGSAATCFASAVRVAAPFRAEAPTVVFDYPYRFFIAPPSE